MDQEESEYLTKNMFYNIIINKYIKLCFAILIFMISIILFFYLKSIKISLLLLLISTILFLFFFKNEFLIMSFLTFRQGNLKKTKQWLSYIKKPQIQLTKKQQAYYFFLKGLINANYNIRKSEIYLRTALNLGLKYSYNRAIAKLNLATILASTGKKKEAEQILIDVKKLDKAGLMNEQIKFVKTKLKKINIGNNNPYFRNQTNYYKKF